MKLYLQFIILLLLAGCGTEEGCDCLQENQIVVDVNQTNFKSEIENIPIEEVKTDEKKSTQNSETLYESNNSLYNHRNITALDIDFQSKLAKNNRAAYVTSQCYTKSIDAEGKKHNPCFSCHINSKEPSYVDDADLQGSSDFGEYSRVNRFNNLFKDRTDIVAQISDDEIMSYVKENNYIQKGKIILAEKLKNIPKEWDSNSDGKWSGYLPDCYFNFDSEGFDRDLEGNYTLWRAFAYYPFLGTFWPTNGSSDDVLIRLPSEFSKDDEGKFDLKVYKLNLAIVESLIKQKSVQIDDVDESLYGVDLNQNGTLDLANEIVFRWLQPSYDSASGKIGNFSMSYVGKAKQLLEANSYMIAPGLYPKNTEFLHSVRYLDVDEKSTIKMAPRMKELRYAKKLYWLTYSELRNSTNTDIKEKDVFPDRLRTIIGNTEYGASNNLGWRYQGFIEAADGELRPQNYEENLYCIGCHSGIGAIADSTFVFQRKFGFDADMQGWYHWSQKGLKDVAEMKLADGRYEYELYLKMNGAGDEFRSNEEVQEKFFEANGSLKSDEVAKVHSDISYLLLPSVERAKELNKAYKVIVEEQSFIYGRDAHIKAIENIYREVNRSFEADLDVIKR